MKLCTAYTLLLAASSLIAVSVAPPPNSIEYCNEVDPPVRLWTLQEVERNNTNCNVVFYDTVYCLDDFIYVHLGGAEPILRNCGTDATVRYENLQCIPTVPDHFPGVLNMCGSSIVGVIKDSPEDPCSDEYGPPDLPDPDFDLCDSYDNITCEALAAGIRPDRPDLDAYAPGGKWTFEMVATAQAAYGDTACISCLFGYCFDFGNSPIGGGKAFYLKHGAGQEPQAILKYCGQDMTPWFEAANDLPERDCLPKHTKGALNAVSGYVIGVIEGSDADPCVPGNEPPEPDCEGGTYGPYLSLDGSNGDPMPVNAGCPIVILGKMYDLADWAPHHLGGANKITTKCWRDNTDFWLGRPNHVPLFHLGAAQKYMIGLIRDGVSDRCGDNYDETLDF